MTEDAANSILLGSPLERAVEVMRENDGLRKELATAKRVAKLLYEMADTEDCEHEDIWDHAFAMWTPECAAWLRTEVLLDGE